MAKQSFVEAVGILDDGLAAVPNQPDLQKQKARAQVDTDPNDANHPLPTPTP